MASRMYISRRQRMQCWSVRDVDQFLGRAGVEERQGSSLSCLHKGPITSLLLRETAFGTKVYTTWIMDLP
jgi:hypothetical protein